jgi:hypothetical protein
MVLFNERMINDFIEFDNESDYWEWKTKKW